MSRQELITRWGTGRNTMRVLGYAVATVTGRDVEIVHAWNDVATMPKDRVHAMYKLEAQDYPHNETRLQLPRMVDGSADEGECAHCTSGLDWRMTAYRVGKRQYCSRACAINHFNGEA